MTKNNFKTWKQK